MTDNHNHHNQHDDHGHGHGHGHHHDHSTEGTANVAQANKDHFDAVAAEGQIDPKWIEMAKMNGIVIRENYDFNEDSTVVMDFACNVGLLSRELAPYAKTMIGIDISQKSVDAFNQTVSNQGISPEEMRAICVDLKGVEGELDGLKFDVITCALSYHHFENIDEITRMLSFFLKPGGALLVIDFLKPESKGDEALFPDKYKHVVPHTHGMKRDGLQDAFEGAGLVEFTLKPTGNIVIHDMEAILFIAKGVKPSS